MGLETPETERITISVTERQEPLLGWRLWRVRGPRLESWAASCAWDTTDNAARCLAPVRRCSRSPGRGCRCGFWGLFSPLRCLDRARAERTERSSVLGLIRAWGEVAVHGQEGFRAEHASVVCLFTDWVWEAATAYGVPLLSLKDALQVGMLEELGADEMMRREVQSWVDLVGPGRMWRSD